MAAPAIAFIGLGIMGRPMAANLVRAGFEVTGFSRTAGSRDAARAAGIPVVDELRTAVDGADTVVTMLPDSPDVAEVLLGDGGVLSVLSDGGTVIDMSTISPDMSRAVFERARERGTVALDAPVSGGESAAIEATLSIMVGGDAEAVEGQRAVFGAMGSTVVHVGGPGAGQVVKSANQLMVAGHIQLLAEALMVLRAHDVDPATAFSVIAKGLAGSTVIDRKLQAMLTGQFDPGFRVALHDKDLGILTEAARRAGLVLPLTAVTNQLVMALVARGDGSLDHSALYKLTKELNGDDQK